MNPFLAILIPTLLGLVAIGLIVFLSFVAYRNGTKSGNVTVSIIMILSGVAFVPGLFHLFGATKCAKGMSFDDKCTEKRELEKQRIIAEIEYYKSNTKQDKK